MTILLTSDEMMSFRRVMLLFIALLVPTVTAAHHSRVEYFGGEMIEIDGEVVSVVWRSPHVMFTVQVETADGFKEWVLEGPGAGSLKQEGLVDGYVSEGEHVRAAGQRSNRRDDWIRITHILGPNGTELVFTSGGPRWSTEFLGGNREVEASTSVGVVPPDGIFRVWVYTDGTPYEITELPPLTAEGMAAYQAYDPLRDDPALECDLPGMPRIMTIAGSRPFQLTRQGENILIESQNFNQTRVIYMNTDVDPSEVEASSLGFSRGRWEGRTLVVETSRINYPFFDIPPWWGIPQTEAIDIVERFSPEGDTLVYDFWAYDPVTFAAPIDRPRALTWTWKPGLEVEIDNCELYFEEP